MNRKTMHFDVAIVGAGPSGLCFARALSGGGLRVLVLERQPESALAEPAFDGREIALTHRSVDILRSLGVWQRIVPDAIAPLRDAQVLNGPSLYAMRIEHRDGGKPELGYLVSNCLIRKAAYEEVCTAPSIRLLCGTRIVHAETDATAAWLTLDNGEQVSADLLVAADSRFSEMRRNMGIAASMHDFGRAMLVCAVRHELPHHHVAWEWFDHGQTLALLPMNGDRASVVLTLPTARIEALRQMPDAEFSRDLERRFRQRLGAMRLDSTRHVYPLVTVYPRRFVKRRFALIGDAAVGMHPVTAHGFNFGLRGVDTLANAILRAHATGGDIAADGLLAAYERAHRRATRPLFLATHFIAKLYSDESPPARLLRIAALHLGNRLTPFRRGLARMLTEADH
ncbi:MAG TPA: 5-demethoxyubiquinol-8 5-hydroxylase UbiM [Methylophilaceae bacterium]